MCMHKQMIVRATWEDTPNKLIFHDFVSFNVFQDPLGHSRKNFEKIEKKNFFDRSDIRKKSKNYYFFLF